MPRDKLWKWSPDFIPLLVPAADYPAGTVQGYGGSAYALPHVQYLNAPPPGAPTTYAAIPTSGYGAASAAYTSPAYLSLIPGGVIDSDVKCGGDNRNFCNYPELPFIETLNVPSVLASANQLNRLPSGRCPDGYNKLPTMGLLKHSRGIYWNHLLRLRKSHHFFSLKNTRQIDQLITVHVYFTFTSHLHYAYFAFTLHSHYIHITSTLHSHYIHIAFTWHSHCIHITFTLHSHCIHCTFTWHSHCIHIASTLHLYIELN